VIQTSAETRGWPIECETRRRRQHPPRHRKRWRHCQTADVTAVMAVDGCWTSKQRWLCRLWWRSTADV